MKHPFQIIVADTTGRYLFTTVKNILLVIDLTSGKLVGQWKDELDNSDFLKKKYEEKFDEKNGPKRQKTESGQAKVPKIPTPGPGAPPIYNYIRALRLSSDEKYLFATTDSDKAVVIFNIDHTKDNCLELKKRQPFAKRPCALSVDEDRLVVADKFGDVYSIAIEDEQVVNEKELTPILGHVSMLSDVAIVSHGEKKFIITGDRDEHIRISNYPKSFVIKNFLFGHHEFVSCLHVPTFDLSLLISGGGDDYLCLWRWYEGQLLAKIELRELIAPFLTESHLPPERFLTETSPKEISVARISTFSNKKTGTNILVVLCEQTKAVLVFEIGPQLSVRHVQTISYEDNILDMCYIEAKNILLSTHDSDKNQLFQQQKFDQETNNFAPSAESMEAVAELNPIDVNSRNDFLPLYYINTLRKRSEH